MSFMQHEGGCMHRLHSWNWNCTKRKQMMLCCQKWSLDHGDRCSLSWSCCSRPIGLQGVWLRFHRSRLLLENHVNVLHQGGIRNMAEGFSHSCGNCSSNLLLTMLAMVLRMDCQRLLSCFWSSWWNLILDWVHRFQGKRVQVCNLATLLVTNNGHLCSRCFTVLARSACCSWCREMIGQLCDQLSTPLPKI